MHLLLELTICIFLYFTYLNSLNGRYLISKSGGENGSTSIIDSRTGKTYYPLPNMFKLKGQDWLKENIYLFKADSLIQESPPINSYFKQ